MQNLFISIGIISVLTYIVSTVMIYAWLKERGEKVSFLWLRLFMIPYASKYRLLSKEETGKVGYLFYVWIISINTALVSAIIILVIN